MRSSDSSLTAGSAHCTAWPVPRCSGWIATSTAPGPNAASSDAFTASCWWPRIATMRPAPAARAAITIQCRTGRPAILWRTFAVSLFIRVPSPAAMMNTMGA